MAASRFRRKGSGRAPAWGLVIAIVLGITGLVAMYLSTEAEEGAPTPTLLGVPLESAWPGAGLLILGLLLAGWSMRAMHHVGSREPRTEVRSWTVQPSPGAKEFGNPPPLPSHRAELAAAGLEAFPISGGQWHVRRLVR